MGELISLRYKGESKKEDCLGLRTEGHVAFRETAAVF